MAFGKNQKYLVVHADGPDCPATAPARVARHLDFANYDLLTGWITRPFDWLGEDGERGYTVMANGAMAGPVNAGRFTYLPVRQSAVPRLLQDVARPDIVVVSGVRRGNDLAFRGSVGWALTAIAHARTVVVEVDESAPDIGAPLIPAPITFQMPRPDGPEGPAAPRTPDEVDIAIGRHVAALIPPEATLQVGPGAIAEAMLRQLDTPIGVWSGICTDAIAELHPRGLLTGSVTTPYIFGGEPIHALADAGRLRIRPITETHNLTAVAAIPRFVALNAALQVGLDGSVNVEQVGGRVFSGMGGHPDYCLAAAQSVGGLSIVALRSTTRKGLSTIVPKVDMVTTPRTDVDIVVTEHGFADLRGAGPAETAERIAAIADPSADLG